MTEKDAPPVFLPEPEAAREAARPSPPPSPPPQGRVVLPEPQDGELHPDWNEVLEPEEKPLWTGRPRTGSGRGSHLLLIWFGIAAALLLAAQEGSILPVFVGVAIFIFLQSHRRRRSRDATRRYLLTDRAAYLARQEGDRLVQVAAWPITPELQIGQAGRSVVFSGEPRGARGLALREAAAGFSDIDEAAEVQAMIRRLQEGWRQ